MVADKMTSNKDIASTNKSLQELEEDFMWFENASIICQSSAVNQEYKTYFCKRWGPEQINREKERGREREVGWWAEGDFFYRIVSLRHKYAPYLCEIKSSLKLSNSVNNILGAKKIYGLRVS